jgi:hypothetical protein
MMNPEQNSLALAGDKSQSSLMCCDAEQLRSYPVMTNVPVVPPCRSDVVAASNRRLEGDDPGATDAVGL